MTKVLWHLCSGTWGLINPLSALDVGSAGQQDDIWALGCALYGLLTGRDLCKEFCAQLVRLKADPRQRQKIKDACRTLDLKPKQTNALITAQLKGLVRTPKVCLQTSTWNEVCFVFAANCVKDRGSLSK